jgi:hypothetical protein
MKNRKSIFASFDIRDPEEAFDNAIRKGLKHPENYMFMYHKDGRDYFKHVDTRLYRSFRHKFDKPQEK